MTLLVISTLTVDKLISCCFLLADYEVPVGALHLDKICQELKESHGNILLMYLFIYLFIYLPINLGIVTSN